MLFQSGLVEFVNWGCDAALKDAVYGQDAVVSDLIQWLLNAGDPRTPVGKAVCIQIVKANNRNIFRHFKTRLLQFVNYHHGNLVIAAEDGSRPLASRMSHHLPEIGKGKCGVIESILDIMVLDQQSVVLHGLHIAAETLQNDFLVRIAHHMGNASVIVAD